MKKLIYQLFFVFVCVSSFAQTFPEKSGHLVSDYTRTLSKQEANYLEQKLIAFSDSTSIQIAIVIVQSLEGYDSADYGVRLAQKWGIGSKKNNGILLLVSLNDRRVTIQTGYGLEGSLPDAIAKRIIENEIKPNFKKGEYYQGLEQGTNAIISYTKDEYKNNSSKEKNASPSKRVIFFVIILALILLIISRINKGGGHGGNQIIGGDSDKTNPLWWFLLGSILSSGRGGGWGPSGNGGRDFGGFGGGGFGGGGASGDW